jgi:hypothetical protein
MPQLTDRAKIRAILERDRLWAAYALADLEPGFFERTSWFSSVDEASALALVYSAVDSAFPTPVLMTFGNVQALGGILHEKEGRLVVRAKILQVDAFTQVAFRGNPAAACLLPDDVSDVWRQAVGAEMNLSETAFVRQQLSRVSKGVRWLIWARRVAKAGAVPTRRSVG